MWMDCFKGKTWDNELYVASHVISYVVNYFKVLYV